MASILLDTATALAATTTQNLAGPDGTWASMNLIVQIPSGSTGAWTITAQYVLETQAIDVAEVTIANAATTQITPFTLTAGVFDATRQAIPRPNRIVYTNDSGTPLLTCNIFLYAA